MFGGHSLHSSLVLGCFPAKICWSRIGAVSAHLFAFTNIWRTRFGATVSAHALSELSWGWNTEFGQVDLWRGFACIDNSLTVFSFFLPNIYRLRVGAVASAYSLLVIPWGWSNGFGQADVWMMFAYLHSTLVVVFVSCSTSIGLGCAVSAPLSAGGGNFKSQIL